MKKNTKDLLIEALHEVNALHETTIKLLEEKIELLETIHQAKPLVAQPVLEMKPVNQWVN